MGHVGQRVARTTPDDSRPQTSLSSASSRGEGTAIGAHSLSDIAVSLSSTKRGVIQRAVGDRPFSDGYANIIGAPSWPEEALSYEKALATYAYGDARSSAAVNATLAKLIATLETYYRARAKSDDEIHGALSQNASDSAGQVGSDLAAIRAVVGGGNLRERMTAIYNAAYFGSDDNSISLKNILHDITLRGNARAATDLDLNVASLNKQREFLTGYSRWGLEGLVRVFKSDKAYNYAPDIYALGNLAAQSGIGDQAEIAMSQAPRVARSDYDKQRGSAKKTPRDYALMGAPLSDREREYLSSLPVDKRRLPIEDGTIVEPIAPDQIPLAAGVPNVDAFKGPNVVHIEVELGTDPVDGSIIVVSAYRLVKGPTFIDDPRASDLAPGVSGPELPLQWVEGTAYYSIDPNSSWYKSVHVKLGMPVVAGVSGTTTRMMKTFEWLNVGGISALDFRLAIMGWMLTSWDHSLYEILRGSEIAGVKGPNEVTDDAISMYMNIPPLSKADLRAHVALGHEFPHERIYHRMVKGAEMTPEETVAKAANPDAPLKHKLKEPGDAIVTESETRQTTLANPAVTRAHAIAIGAYTGGMHALMNAALSLPAIAAKPLIRSKLHYVVDWTIEFGVINDKITQGTATAADHARHAVLLQDYQEWTAILDPLKPTVIALSSSLMPEQQRAMIRRMLDGQIDAMVPALYEELKTHANMTVEGLSALPPVKGVTVFRGDWKGAVSWTYGGSTITFNTLTSTSATEDVAVEFAQRYVGGSLKEPVVLTLHLTGKGGREISALSQIPGEAEILLMPGTHFTVLSNAVVNGVNRISAVEA